MVDLLTEFAGCIDRMTSAGDDYLVKRLGVSPRALYGGASHVGVDRVEFRTGGFYEPAETGAPVLVVPLGWQFTDSPGWADIVDLVAFRAASPEMWISRLGIGVLLGLDNAEHAEHFGTDLILWSTPLRWLQAGCVGACVIRWDRAALGLHLTHIHRSGQLIAETDTLGARLDDLLNHPRKRPVIRVLKEFAHAA